MVLVGNISNLKTGLGCEERRFLLWLYDEKHITYKAYVCLSKERQKALYQEFVS